jgi:hypothetical protein
MNEAETRANRIDPATIALPLRRLDTKLDLYLTYWASRDKGRWTY